MPEETNNKSERFVPPLIFWNIVRRGKLYLQKPDSIVEISEAWPKPAARAITRCRPEWHRCTPEIQLDSSTPPYAEFFRAVPAEVRSLLGAFPGWHWELLCGVAASTAVMELLRANPALGLMSQVFWKFQAGEERSVGYAASLAARRHREIAGALGFPATKWAVRVLAKIPKDSLGIRDLLTIRCLMNDSKSAKWLRHIEYIDGPLLCLIRYPYLSKAASWRLINEVALEHSEQVSGKIVMRLIELDDYHRRVKQPVDQPYRTVQEVESAWQAMKATARSPTQDFVSHLRSMQFPVAPLPCDIGIKPLLSKEAINLECREQSNCVDSYASAARAGKLYLFKVIFPERATLAVKCRRGHWYCSELKGPKNRPVRPSTRTYIRRWLVRANEACT